MKFPKKKEKKAEKKSLLEQFDPKFVVVYELKRPKPYGMLTISKRGDVSFELTGEITTVAFSDGPSAAQFALANNGRVFGLNPEYEASVVPAVYSVTVKE